MNTPLTADEIIKELNLKPHPEGGWFRETFRDEKGHGDRAHSTGRRGRTLAPCGRD
jgi:predicted cupin superfamily sugar epimerase